MFRYSCLVVLLLVALVNVSRGDFFLTDTQHRDVTSHHELAMLYDSSTADVKSGGRITNAYVNNDALLQIMSNSYVGGLAGVLGGLYVHNAGSVNISGGGVQRLQAYNNSTVDISDGGVGSHWVDTGLYAYGNSSVNISGGRLYFLNVYDTATVNMSGGSAEDWERNSGISFARDNSSVNISGGYIPRLDAHESSSIDMSGGSIGNLYARSSSTVEISGGSVDLRTYDTSTVKISGGTFSPLKAHGNSSMEISGGSFDYHDSLSAHDTSTVTFHGYDFHAFGGDLRLEDERVLGHGILSGKWFDGTTWAIDIEANASGARICVVPEPSTLAMLGMGVVGLLAWMWQRRHRI